MIKTKKTNIFRLIRILLNVNFQFRPETDTKAELLLIHLIHIFCLNSYTINNLQKIDFYVQIKIQQSEQ